MASNVGPLLQRAIERVQAATSEELSLAVAAQMGAEEDLRLPVVVQLGRIRPETGEGWQAYARRARSSLERTQAMLLDLMGASSRLLVAANALRTDLLPEQAAHVAEDESVQLVELDPLVQLTSMDDAGGEIGLPEFRAHNGDIDGAGVRVAVLDSGVDMHHPYVRVVDAVSTCGETVDLAGKHGTHCAGIIASQDTVFRGVAPGVDLLNVKVLMSDGRGRHTYITAGIDAALDRGAQVLSMSLGFNHLPPWSWGGHGWSCPDGRCPLCTAVDNAVELEGVVAVVAAGNEHQRAENLRQWGQGGTFDTELGCPGQAEHAITVGAHTKSTFLPAPFSSHGPAAYGLQKPTLAAPGVNITSTVPVARDASGVPVAAPSRSALFERMSGTSMATPIVAGAAALLLQLMGNGATPGAIRDRLLSEGTVPTGFGVDVLGVGRLQLAGI